MERSPAGRPGPLLPDLLLAAYLAATGGAALASGTGTGAGLSGLHLAGVGLILWGSRRPLPRGRVLLFFRIFYPVALTPLLYAELATLNRLLFPDYFDAAVQRWEAAVFGLQPSLSAARELPALWLSEALHLGYFSYYLVVPGAAVAAFWRSGARGLTRLTGAVALAFFVCYLCFAVFPVAGPRYEFAPVSGEPARGAVFGLVHGVLEAASSKGTAFPSSHIAASVAALLATWREARGWFWITLLPVLLLVAGTVYGRFHYALDALAGIAVGAAAWAAIPWLRERSGL